MCPPIIGVVIGIVGSLASAAMTSQVAKQQAAIEQTQLRTEMENERIKAIGDTTDRLMELNKQEAMNRAALSVSGLDENFSYIQGIAPYNAAVAAHDVGRIEFGAGQVIGRKKYEIAVAGWKAKTAARSAFIQAGVDSLGSVAGYIARPSGSDVSGTPANRIV